MNKTSYGDTNDLNLRLVIALTRSSQSVHRRGLKIVKGEGLTPSQFGALEVLYHKGNLRINELIEKTLSTGGNMTVVIDNLEKEDLIKRCPDPEDRRATLVCITQKGRDLLDDLFPRHVEGLQEIFQGLTDEEKENLLVLLKKVSGIATT